MLVDIAIAKIREIAMFKITKIDRIARLFPEIPPKVVKIYKLPKYC